MPLPQKKIYNLEEAREKIRRYCAYQERSQKQVSDKLKSYGLLPFVVDELLLELIQENYLNEERFAKAFARGRFSIKGWGKQKIKFALKAHGVSEPCIARALEEIVDDAYQEKLAQIAQKKWDALEGNHPRTRKQKVINYLMGRGYIYADIKLAINQILSKD
jgi:regulatory protein